VKEQDYLLKKFVRATSAAAAIAMDKSTDVHEVYLVQDKPTEGSGKWMARLKHNKKSVFLGRFVTKAQALHARRLAVKTILPNIL
jgi:hypothetical protein